MVINFYMPPERFAISLRTECDGYVPENADPSECDPDGNRPCCGIGGICGNSRIYCKCGMGCTDYREVKKWRNAGWYNYMYKKL